MIRAAPDGLHLGQFFYLCVGTVRHLILMKNLFIPIGNKNALTLSYANDKITM
jgi:hypothetical protein